MATVVRGGRAIKDNKCGYLPRYIIAVDTETLPEACDPDSKYFSHRFRLGVAISCRLRGTKVSGERVTRLASPNDFLDLLTELSGPRHTVWIVAHNALFDFITLRLPEAIEQGKLSLTWPRRKREQSANGAGDKRYNGLAVIESPPTVIAMIVGATQGRVTIVDTLNWFPSSLAVLGESIGKAKLAMPSFAADDETWYRYCENDSRIVFDTFIQLIRWVDSHNFGQFRFTAASQAYNAWRHAYYTHKVYPHDDEPVKAIERASYFAGRAECFRRGTITGRVWKLDVRSMFPSVMQSNLFPYTLERYEHRPTYLALQPGCDPSECIAEVIVSSRDALYPAKHHEKPCFPRGAFRCVLAGPELSDAIGRGCVQSFKSWVHYRVEPLFAAWVGDLWAMRQKYEQEKQPIFAELCKLFMNSLYGKFAQRTPKWENDPAETVINPWSTWGRVNSTTGRWNIWRSFGYIAQKQSEPVERPGNFPAISSFVTSYARLLMNKYRAIAGHENVYYQGIDSLIVNDEGAANLFRSESITRNEIGKLRVMGVSQGCELRGIGDYTFGEDCMIGGLPKRHDTIEQGVYQQRKFLTGPKLFDGKAYNEVQEQVSEWRRSFNSSRGNYDSAGWLAPFELGEISYGNPSPS